MNCKNGSDTNMGTGINELVTRSTRKVMEQAQHVGINPEKTIGFAKHMSEHFSQFPVWDKERHFWDNREHTAQWVLVLDTLNFSFWPDEGKDRWLVNLLIWIG